MKLNRIKRGLLGLFLVATFAFALKPTPGVARSAANPDAPSETFCSAIKSTCYCMAMGCQWKFTDHTEGCHAPSSSTR